VIVKTKVISVKVQSLISISDKAYKITSFDGSSDIIPKSQVFGEDFSNAKSESYWISEWILNQKNIQYSRKKTAFWNDKTNRIEPIITVEKHTPKKIEFDKNQLPDESLIK
jgi:hypothetical protein